MIMQHKDISLEQWATYSLNAQLANIGSEVIRATRWRKKGNEAYSTLAFYRALELLDVTLATQMPFARKREISRIRSVLVDDFIGGNIYKSTDLLWERYFMAYTYAANVVNRRVV